jgi:hypothetical protein
VSEVGRDEGGDGDEKAGEMCFHAGLLDITTGKQTAWARSGCEACARDVSFGIFEKNEHFKTSIKNA